MPRSPIPVYEPNTLLGTLHRALNHRGGTVDVAGVKAEPPCHPIVADHGTHRLAVIGSELA
jgi:hypothetical protein